MGDQSRLPREQWAFYNQDVRFTYTIEGELAARIGTLIVVPEPGTLAMVLGTAVLGLLLLAIRRRRKA